MDWFTWAQDVAGGVISKAADAKFVQPYEIEKLRLQALGDLGVYTEGQPGTRQPAQPAGLTINPTTMLLIGGAVLAVMMLRD